MPDGGLIRHIEVDEILMSRWRNLRYYLLGKVSVRIKERETLPVREILEHKRSEESGLSGASLPNHIQVTAPVGSPNTKGYPGIAMIGSGEVCDVAIRIHSLIVSDLA